MVYSAGRMCPFTIAKIGGGGGIGVDVQQYTWTHNECMEKFCMMWVYKKWEDGTVSENCVFKFQGFDTQEQYKFNTEKTLEESLKLNEAVYEQTKEKPKKKGFLNWMLEGPF